jgi:adenylyltransferase/sulfurtransferase
MKRYLRQTILPQIGDDGQNDILSSSVLIVGAGGLGHPTAQYLAGMGVGQISIIDGDEVQLTNLHRQILFTDKDLGHNKANVLANRISKINSDLKIKYFPQFLDKKLALTLFQKFDVIIDCSDNFETKFLINDVCALYDKPMVYGAISQFEGQVGVFWKSKGGCYRCLYKEVPKANIENCAESGVVGPVVGAIGSIQALETMKLLVKNRPCELPLTSLVSKINFYDFSSNSFRSLKITKQSSCRCHDTSFNENQIAEFSKKTCAIDTSALLVDVREIDEWNEFHIKDSLHWPLSDLEKGVTPNLDKEQKIILICKAGTRAQVAMGILKKFNFKNLECYERSIYEYQTR